MKVFLSWSGEVSCRVAEALREWFPNVIQALEPWMSSEDIEKGTRWSSEMAGQLSETTAGIVCLTADNLRAPWIHFEAGALSKTIQKTLVCPYLFGIKPTDVYGPLVQFQAAESNREDTDRLLRTMNKALGRNALSEKQLEKTYSRWWPDLDERLRSIAVTKHSDKVQVRSDRELLEEVLMLVRAVFGTRFAEYVSNPPPPTGPATSGNWAVSGKALAEVLAGMPSGPLRAELTRRLQEFGVSGMPVGPEPTFGFPGRLDRSLPQFPYGPKGPMAPGKKVFPKK